MKTLFTTGNLAKIFREDIRPSLIGKLGEIEPALALSCAQDLEKFLNNVVQQATRTTTIKDRKGAISRQLQQGIKVVGRGSLSTLVGRIDVRDWMTGHEFGAHIRPKGHDYMAVPVFDALRADGTPKFRSPLSWKRFGSFIYHSPNTDKLYIAYNKNGHLSILYLLVSAVDLKARLGINAQANRQIGQLIDDWFYSWINLATRSALINFYGARSANE